jgi:hypothetical protein
VLTRPATLPGPWIDQSFLFLTLPGLLVSSVGSTVLGIALLRNHFRPRVTPWLLVLWIPLLLAITQITSMGNTVLPALWAWAIAIRSAGSLDPSSSSAPASSPNLAT